MQKIAIKILQNNYKKRKEANKMERTEELKRAIVRMLRDMDEKTLEIARRRIATLYFARQ